MVLNFLSKMAFYMVIHDIKISRIEIKMKIIVALKDANSIFFK